MDSPLYRLSQLVEDAASEYARLVLIVGQHGTGKTRLLREFGRASGHRVIDVGAELPPILFDVPPRRRPVVAADGVSEMLRGAGAVVGADDLELLFHPELALDPLKLLQDNARNRVVVAAWPGTFGGQELTFAEPGHPEFRAYPAADLQVLTL